MKKYIAICLLVLPCTMLYAQGVYMTPGDKGPVFSDKPQPGAKEISLPPLNVITPPPREAKPAPAAGAAQPAPAAAVALDYQRFAVVTPENNGSVLANTAMFEVRVAVDPPLQIGLGHAFAVAINGRPVAGRFTANEFLIPPEFWGDTLPPANQSMQIDASIVGDNGQVLKKAAPVRFFMRHVTINNNPQRPRPAPRPLPPR